MPAIHTPSSSQSLPTPYTRFQQRSHRPLPSPAYSPRTSKRNATTPETLAHRFSRRWLSGIGKDQMLSEVEYMLIAKSAAEPADNIRQSVYLDEQRRHLVYSGTLHLTLAALWFREDVEALRILFFLSYWFVFFYYLLYLSHQQCISQLRVAFMPQVVEMIPALVGKCRHNLSPTNSHSLILLSTPGRS